LQANYFCDKLLLVLEKRGGHMGKLCRHCNVFASMEVTAAERNGDIKIIGWSCPECGTVEDARGNVLYGVCPYCDSDIVAREVCVDMDGNTEITDYMCRGCGLLYGRPPDDDDVEMIDEEEEDNSPTILGVLNVCYEIVKRKHWCLLNENGKIIGRFDGRRRIQTAITHWSNNELSKCQIVFYHIELSDKQRPKGAQIYLAMPVLE
jgi:hypothetical protein